MTPEELDRLDRTTRPATSVLGALVRVKVTQLNELITAARDLERLKAEAATANQKAQGLWSALKPAETELHTARERIARIAELPAKWRGEYIPVGGVAHMNLTTGKLLDICPHATDLEAALSPAASESEDP